MYLRRKVDGFLREWKKDIDKNPLIIRGSRQVGKTRSIRHFAEQNYENYIEINFVTEPKYRAIIQDGYSAEAITKIISRLDPSIQFIPGKTLILFDEIQEFPEIATSLKFFKEQGDYDVVCSGSLLGINYKRIESVSVGYKTDYDMRSLDFEEFLWAKGYKDDLMDDILSHMANIEPFKQYEMDLYMSLFIDFCILGGMPAVVKRYIETARFDGTLEIQRQILRDYEEDIRKYLEGLEQTKVLDVYRQIAPQLAKENKKFQISLVAHNATNNTYRGCVEWLSDAGIINICRCLRYPELPLGGNFEQDKYKLYFSDTGLLVASLDEESQLDLRANKYLGIYKGALYENFIAEALVKEGYDLYYYKKRNSTLEQDFFIRSKQNLIPLEIKAKDGRSKSLHTLISNDIYPDISYGVKLCANNIGYANNIYTFPYFCSFLLKKYINER